MPDSVTPNADLILKHQPNLGEDVADVEISAGEELVVLKEWEDAYLVKDAEGRLFNVAKDQVDPA